MTPGSTKRTRLTIRQKLDILHEIESGVQYSTLVRKHNVSLRTLNRIRKTTRALKNTVDNAAISTNVKTVHKLQFTKIESHLMAFVQFCRQARKPVTLATLSYRALKIRDSLLAVETDEINKSQLRTFCASKNWCLAFTRRHALRSQSLHGEAGSANAASIAKEISELRKKLGDYPLDHIYNMDKTGLFFKLLPRRTYVMEVEGKRTVRGIKAMKAKDRITAFLCTNADRSRKVDLSIIGKAKNPRCFRVGRPDVVYFSHKNAWADSVVFKRWFYDLFLAHVRKTTSRPVALVMDNCGPQGSDTRDSRGQVTIFPLPPNCTSIHQPMDLGVIAEWKAIYRRNLLVEMIEDIENQESRREENKNKPAGMKGLAEGYESHMLDVSRLCKNSWDAISKDCIARCWARSGILPVSDTSDLVQLSGKVNRTKKEEEVLSDIFSMFQSLSLRERDQLFGKSDAFGVTSSDVQDWVDVEINDAVQDATVEDAMERDAIGTDTETQQATEMGGDKDEDDGNAVCSAAIPKPSALSEMFNELEQMCFNCNLPQAAILLRRAKKEIETERSERGETGRKRQLLLTEFWKVSM